MLKKNRLMILFSLLLVFSFALAACGTTTDEPAADEPAADVPAAEEPAADAPAAEEPAVESPAERKVATFIWTQEFDTLNPYYSNMWFSTITQELWNQQPWIFDDANGPVPVLLKEMPSVSDDGMVITMNLRDELVWSDGEPLTADDFVFTYNMVMDPANTVASTYPFDQLTSMEATDERTVVMTFAEPFVPWVATMWSSILPEHILAPVFEAEGTIDEAPWNLEPTVSAGPFVFAEWESGSFVRFVRNDNYWGEPPKIDEIFFQFVPDDAAQVAALQTGDGDLGTFISYADVPTLEAAGVDLVTIKSGYNEGWFPLLWDNASPGILDVNVRKAMVMAFDRDSLNEDLLLGLTNTAASFWDNTPYVDPSIEPYPYDPEAAKALLEEAGWVDTDGDGIREKDGQPLVIRHGTSIREVRQDAQAVAQQQLAEVGIQLDIQSFDADILFAGFGDEGPCTTGEMDICEWSDTTAYPDPDIYYWLCSEIPTAEYPDGANWQNICNEELDGLFQAQAVETDPDKRTEMFHQISLIMHENVYWVGLWQDPDIWALNGRIQNAKISGVDPFFNIVDWELTD